MVFLLLAIFWLRSFWDWGEEGAEIEVAFSIPFLSEFGLDIIRKRSSFGKELMGSYLKTIMPEVDRDISLFPPVFLDKISTADFWGVHDVCKQHNCCKD